MENANYASLGSRIAAYTSDIIIPWMVGMAMILINDENKRVGDLLASTIVVDA